MSTEQLILQELRALSQKVERLEQEIEKLKNKSQILGPKPSVSLTPKGGDIWGGLKPAVVPKLIDGHEEIMKPLVFSEDAMELILAAQKEYRENQEKLMQKWRDDPSSAPQYGIKKGCEECGLSFENGALSYSCPRNNCPSGMGPTIC